MILRLRCEDNKYHNCDKLKLQFKIYYNIYDDLDDYYNINVVGDNDDCDYYRYINVTMLLIINICFNLIFRYHNSYLYMHIIISYIS